MKRICSLLLIGILLLPCLPFPASAEEAPVIADMESLLTADEIFDLTDRILQLEQAYGIDILIVTTPSFYGATAQNYADDYYDQHGGADDGVLFLLSMTEREWYISTCGSMIYTLTDYSIQQIGEQAIGYLANGDYYDGFACFLNALPEYLDACSSGAPVDGYADYAEEYYHGTQEEVVYSPEESSPNFYLSLVIGVAAAAVTVIVMRSAMNTKRPQRSASVYLKDGSWQLRTHRDLFLYSNVTKTRRQQNSGSSGHGGGGSSVHRSSGGRRHGGGGGRF